MIQIKCFHADAVFTSFCFSPLQVENMRRRMMQCLCISPNFFFIFWFLQIFGSKSYFLPKATTVFCIRLQSKSKPGWSLSYWAHLKHKWDIQPIHLDWLVNFCTINIEHQASSYRIVIVLQWWTGGWYWLVGSQWDTTQPSIHHSMASSNPT